MATSRQETIAGVSLEIVERGPVSAAPAGRSPRTFLVLHGGEGLAPERPWLDLLAAQSARVIAPWHPGWGGSSLPDHIGTVDDLAYLYLDLADRLDLHEAVLVGCSFGGWVAAEMLVRSSARFSAVVLVAPLGIKVSAPDVRDIADMHAMGAAELLAATWADPSKGRIDYETLPETELARIVRGREAFALFGWKPYMHNPRLRQWLHRAKVPTTLIWGDRDGIVTPAYRQGWARAIPHATSVTIEGSGHFPLLEQPEATVTAIVAAAAQAT